MIKHFFLLLFLVSGLFIHPIYGQKKRSNGLVPARGGDPFTGQRKLGKINLHFFSNEGQGGKQVLKSRAKKEYSLKTHQINNRNAYRGNMSAKGIHKQYNVSADKFNNKSSKHYKRSGPRGETFRKKKHQGILKMGSRNGHETRRMDRSNKKSFKK